MSKVNVKVTLKNGEGCQIVIKIGSETLNFKKSGAKAIELPAKIYIALIAGFLDPSGDNPSAVVEFRQGDTLLNSITIAEEHFIKPLKVTVS